MSKADSIKARLLRFAVQSGKSNEYIQTHYFIERLLHRLSVSRYANDFVLKGGLLLHAMLDNRARATRDIDMLAQHINNTPEQMFDVFREICSIQLDDGISFDLDNITAEVIIDNADFSGVRIKILCFLDKSRSIVQFDIGFGDKVVPNPERMVYPSLLDTDDTNLWVYSKESVIAEKFQAMVSLAEANSRMKDLYDVAMLASSYDFDGAVLREAIAQTLKRRATPMHDEPIVFSDTYAKDTNKQIQWSAFVKRAKVTKASLEDELAIIHTFIHPIYQAILQENEFPLTWSHADRLWK